MNNSLNSIPSVNTITIANIGTTKCGKTTSIAALTSVEEPIIKLAGGDDGRTKTTVEYHIVTETDNNEIFVEEIELFEQNIMGSADGNIEKYNIQIDTYKVLKNVLNLSKLKVGQNVRNYITQQIDAVKNKPANMEFLKKLMCSETIDTFVRKLTLKVPAHSKLSDILENNKIDLRIRDTRGLLDIMLNSDLKTQTSKSLSELGLDNLDGIVFFCSDEYPNIVAELYKDVLKNVFESLPVFLVHNRTDVMYEMFSMNGQEDTFNNIEAMINCIQDKSHPIFKPEVVEGKSNSTFKLLEKLEIGTFNNGIFNFKDLFFANENVQFLFPACSSLTKGSFAKSKDFNFLQLTTIASYNIIINMVLKLQESIEKIFSNNIAKKYISSQNTSLRQKLLSDFNKYDNSYIGYASTDFVKPQLQYLTCNDINADISNHSYQPLGPRGGITTMNNGKLRYATTAVVAVTARRWISHLIDEIVLTCTLVDNNGNDIFDNAVTPLNIQQSLLKRALFNRLYKQYTDTEATIQYYLLVNRRVAVDGINKTCNQYNNFSDVITDIVDKFI